MIRGKEVSLLPIERNRPFQDVGFGNCEVVGNKNIVQLGKMRFPTEVVMGAPLFHRYADGFENIPKG